MPDISMCQDRECPKAQACYRSELSGTRPCEFRQCYFADSMRTIRPKGDGCEYYWPTVVEKA